MTIRYATLEQIKKLGRFRNEWDPELEVMIEAAEAEVDHYCGRRFDSITGTRNLHIRTENIVPVGDWISIGNVIVEGVALVPGDYQPKSYRTEDRPARDLRLKNHRAGRGDTAIVTGTFGWPAVPAPVTASVIILGQRLFARGDHPTAMVANEAGGISAFPRHDPDVRRLLNPYRVPKFSAG